ncbi:hypothetical protein [Francisella salimarina]
MTTGGYMLGFSKKAVILPLVVEHSRIMIVESKDSTAVSVISLIKE